MTDAKGVLAIFIDPEGNVIASAADFDGTVSAGFTLAEAQEYRAKRALTREVLHAYCSDRIVPRISDHLAVQVVENLIRSGWKRQIVAIGHPDAGHG